VIDWNEVAPMVVGVVMFLTIGAVLILRPISKRVGELLEIYAKEKDSGAPAEMRRVRELLESVDARLRLVEERQDFTDKLLEAHSTRERERLAPGPERRETGA
jgi:hypothetical protein